jgi:TonB-linked SusC/RagA family outer membrane protein
MKKSKSFFLSMLLFIPIVVFAQKNQQISGVVKTQDNEPVIGASIKEVGSNRGVITDAHGNFNLTLSQDNASLYISYIGLSPQEVKVNNKTFIEVFLKDSDIMLDEVVVTALGIKRESRALGYAVSEVKGEDLTSGRETNIMSALSGKVAGVDISTTSAGPSGSTRVIIRGNSELSGDNMPLYVVDGVVMDNTQLGEADRNGGYDYGDGLSAISSDDIESISVLKGASASALYGSRATHGVVLITTKSGIKRTGIGVEFSSNISTTHLLSQFDDYQRSYGQGRNGEPPLDMSTAQQTTQTSWGAKLNPDITTYIYNGKLKTYENIPNNILSFFRTGSVITNSLSFSGGNDVSNFRVSLSDMRNFDIVPNSDMNRTSFMVRGNSQLGSKLTIESRVNYTIENVNNRPALSDSPNNIGNSIIGIAPNFHQEWLSENYIDEYGRYVDWNGGNIYRMNPYWVINEMSNTSRKNRVLGYLQLNYKLAPFLDIQVKGGTDFYGFEASLYSPRYTPTAANGEMQVKQSNVSESNVEALVRFNKRINKFNISAFAGGNIRYNERKTYENNGTDEVQAGIRSILNYVEKTLTYLYTRKQVNSLYGAVNLAYNDYAYIDFTLRNDVSSTLAPQYRSYIYPSVSGSFIFSKFFEIENTFLSFGKLRASWAQVGGDTSPYLLDLSYGLYDYSFQGIPLGQIKSTTIPNLYLKPTTTRSYEFGADLRFFKGRITLDAGYYKQSTTDQILSLSTSSAAGYGRAMINAGEIVNHGIEVSFSADIIKKKNFNWNTTVNLARNKNKVVSLHPDVKNYQLAAARWADAFIYAAEGEAYGVIVGKGFKRDEKGNVIFENGLPTYEDNVKILGNGTYDFTMGLRQSLHYKRFSLSVLFDLKWGADIYSMSTRLAHANGTSRNTLEGREAWYASEEQRKAANAAVAGWTATGGYVGEGVKNIGSSDEPIYVKNDVYVDPQTYWQNVTTNTAEPFIYDASYIKLRELNLSYSLPARVLAKTPFVSVSLTFYGRNLLILYDSVKNIDPESNYNSGNGQGFEYGSLPSRRNIGFGLSVKL